MNYKISDEAKFELHKAQCYFKLIGKDEAFLNDLVNQFQQISSMPYAFQVRYKSVRIIGLEYFNYSIHYTIYKRQVYILHILNQKQDF